MTSFDFYNPVKLLFGAGAFSRLGETARIGEHRAMLVTGRAAMRKLGYLDAAVAMLKDRGLGVVVYDQIPPNPTDCVVDEGGELAREEGCDLVVGLGGGSSMDAAKAIAVAATHDFPIREFLVPGPDGSKRVPTEATLPVVCVTTTAGTSSELTPFAVVTVPDCLSKSAIASPLIYARAGICDPELTHHVPPDTTAATGVDILCHAVEGYISTAASPLTDRAAEEAIRLVGQYLPRAVADGSDAEARHYLSLANVFAGFPLSNSGANIMHALEHPVSAHFPAVAHGAGLASLLIAYARTMWEVSAAKFARVSALLEGPGEASACADTFQALLDTVGLNIKLAGFGLREDQLETIADDAFRTMGGALAKTPGCPDKVCVLKILRASM